MSDTLSITSPFGSASRLLPPPDSLLLRLLGEQQTTAVEKFAQWHADQDAPLHARHFRDLIPLTAPTPGQQYAFEVELDACSGCKACVVACHALNGLEEQEAWRAVGLLHGGSSELPVVQHVTTACHHCLEPPCLEGCPVLAYEKDPATGIVRHLDDQCIGCQYCVLKCPYDVPKYSRAKGIVRKCDMCRDRLSAGEAPACVQACPNGAIRITLVDLDDVRANAEANMFLPGAPEPSYTLPTTVYKTRRPLPANLLPADYYTAAPQHAHWPLVAMLVLTQMSVGAFSVEQLWQMAEFWRGAPADTTARAWHVATAFLLGISGLAASVFHLGRPWLAYRAIIGWRTSWLSREVLAFGCFASCASLYAALTWIEAARPQVSPAAERFLGGFVALSGLAGVGCSAMIYASTRRVLWNAGYTGLKYLLTCAILGIPLVLLVQSAAAVWTKPAGKQFLELEWPAALLWALAAAVATKLTLEAGLLAWLRARTLTPLRRTAALMTGDLRQATAARFACGALGGLILPTVLAVTLRDESGPAPWVLAVILIVILSLNLTGELLERFLFFAAVVAPKMPGAPVA